MSQHRPDHSLRFQGFPYLVTRIVPALSHVIVLPDATERKLLEWSCSQFSANRLHTCLVLANDQCTYFEPDGSRHAQDIAPFGGNLVSDRLKISSAVPRSADLESREKELRDHIRRRRSGGFITGDLKKGGHTAGAEELKRLGGVQSGSVPMGLLRCELCAGWRGECLDPNPYSPNWVVPVHCKCANDNRCAACLEPLHEWRLNSNFYDAETNTVWHMPGFCGLNHECV